MKHGEATCLRHRSAAMSQGDDDLISISAEPVARSYVSQRLRLNFVDWGNREAPTVLLLHGRRDHCRSWDAIAQALSHDWHVLALDLRGHGDSQWASDGNYPMAGFIYDLSELIEQEQLSPVALIGHSLGANVSLRYAGIYPDRVTKLVAIEGLNANPKSLVGKPQQPFAASMAEWIARQREIGRRAPRRYPSLEDACARMREKHRNLDATQAQHLTRYGLKRNDDGTLSWKFDNFLYCWPNAEMSEQESRQLFNRITCPVLLIHGAESSIPDPRSNNVMIEIPHARLITIPGAGHWAHHDRSDEVVEYLRDFLQGNASGEDGTCLRSLSAYK